MTRGEKLIAYRQSTQDFKFYLGSKGYECGGFGKYPDSNNPFCHYDTFGLAPGEKCGRRWGRLNGQYVGIQVAEDWLDEQIEGGEKGLIHNPEFHLNKYPFGNRSVSSPDEFVLLTELSTNTDWVICGIFWDAIINAKRRMEMGLEFNIDDARGGSEERILTKALNRVVSIGFSVNQICPYLQRPATDDE